MTLSQQPAGQSVAGPGAGREGRPRPFARIQPYPATLFAMWRGYLRVRPIRDAVLRPAIWLLAAVGATPNTLSFTGIVAMGGFAWLVPQYPRRAVGLMALSWLLDISDGALARHLRRDGDRGKFTDMVCDTAVFALMVIGVVRAGWLHPLAGLALAYLMLLSKVLRCVQNALFLESDWHFKAVAGFFPNALVGVFYALTLLAALAGIPWFRWPALASIGLLTMDALIFHHRILSSHPPGKNSG